MGFESIAALIVVVIFIAVLVAGVVVGQRRSSRRPGYANGDEVAALEGVLAAAGGDFDRRDSRYRAFNALRWRLPVAYSSYFGYVFKRDDVILIAPLAERWLSGELPHLLAPEYDDEIRVPLLRFKVRMQANGFWPSD